MHSKKYLDFGSGFYLTAYAQQAEKWAKRKAIRTGGQPVVNVYTLPDTWDGLQVMRFYGADEKWLDFVCTSRKGSISEKQWIFISPANWQIR